MKIVSVGDSLTMGFALFAMFFGAGNLIFPPYLGFTSGGTWFIGFLCFIVADVGISLLVLFTIARIGEGLEGITNVLGRMPSKIFCAAVCLCIGPLIAIPRTGAITFEIGLSPLTGGKFELLITGIYFLLCLILGIKRAEIIDLIGKILSPILVVALLVLVVKGLVDPVGSIETADTIPNVIKNGTVSGYQTMDMMGGAVFSMAIVYEITNKGYRDAKSQFSIIAAAGILSGLLLFIVYGGLAWLGATASSTYPEDITQTDLLGSLTSAILGSKGYLIMSIIVTCACITTAVGLLTSVSSYFSDLTGGKVKYSVFIIIFSVFAWIISNCGISMIIAIATPVLEVMYPVLIVLTLMRLFRRHIIKNYVYIITSAVTALVSILRVIGSLIGVSLGMDKLPLADFGFEWLLPAVLTFFITVIISVARRDKS